MATEEFFKPRDLEEEPEPGSEYIRILLYTVVLKDDGTEDLEYVLYKVVDLMKMNVLGNDVSSVNFLNVNL